MLGLPNRSDPKWPQLAACAAQLIIISATTTPAQAQPATAENAEASASEVDEASRLHAQVTELYGAGRFAEAEPLARRALEIRERVSGRVHADTLAAVINLGRIHRALGRLSEAEPLFRRVAEANESLHGRDHPDTLTAYNLLGLLYQEQGRHAEAEIILRRALEVRERVLGRDHPDTLTSVNNLASLLHDQGRYAEAEPLYRRALENRSRVLGRDHNDTLISANNLAVLYNGQGRSADAEPLYLRVIEGSERGLGPDHPISLAALTNLAEVYRRQRRFADAEPLYRRSIEGRERVLGRDHPATLMSVNNLGVLYRDQRRYAEAEPLYLRVLEASERLLGREHPDTLISVINLALLYRDLGRFAEGEKLYRRALDAHERGLGRDHPHTLLTALSLVMLQLHQPTPAPDALANARRLVEGVRQRRRAGGSGQQARAQREREGAASSMRFALFADVAWMVAPAGSQRQLAVLPEAFAALQDSVAGAADRSVAEQAARRYVSGRNPELAELMRERQRLENEWTRLESNLAASFADEANDENNRPAAIRAQLESVQARIENIDTRLRAEAPDYFALIEPAPVTLVETQRLLAADEAVLLVTPSRFGTHVMAVTRDGVRWHRSDWNAERVRTGVQRLRWDAGALVSGSEEELAQLRTQSPQEGRARFDRTTAYMLHQQLIAPIHSLLVQKRRVYVAAGGPLAGLPFTLLVSAAPTGADDDPAALRATRWFGDEFALVHVPSIQSLALLRRGSASRARGGFLGVGDPLLGGAGEARRRGMTRGLMKGRRLLQPDRSRDGALIADVAELARMPRLPGTALELEAVRRTLGAPRDSLLLGPNATEPNVRNAELSQARVILFSTHGLTATEAAGVGEAGLVLTPPVEPSNVDDGFLAASEVTSLRLNADWVILSACNTATGGGTDNAGLGPLARAFFYAGARNLLASHWPVSDRVAPILITRTLALERSGASRAEAFRQAMREIRMDASHDTAEDSWAHPFYWAPFVLIGEGGR